MLPGTGFFSFFHHSVGTKIHRFLLLCGGGSVGLLKQLSSLVSKPLTRFLAPWKLSRFCESQVKRFHESAFLTFTNTVFIELLEVPAMQGSLTLGRWPIRVQISVDLV